MFSSDRELNSSQQGNPTGFQTDVRRRTNLSTATNALRSAAVETKNDSLGLSSLQTLSEIEDEFNRIIDKDVETLVEGMEEIIDLSATKSPDKLRSLQDSLAIELRTETMIRSCTSLMSLSHFMKMLWLIGDESQAKKIQDFKINSLNSEIDLLKSDATQLIQQLKFINVSPPSLHPSAHSSPFSQDHPLNLTGDHVNPDPSFLPPSSFNMNLSN